MKILYNPLHKAHHPPFEVFNGDRDKAMEIPDRAENIYAELKLEKYNFIEDIQIVPTGLLESVHDKQYLHFLEDSCATLKEKEYQYPSIWPYTQDFAIHQDENAVAQLGRYIFDTYTPLLRETYNAAIRSASLAYTAAELLHQNPHETYYALCRPPGHHAEHTMAGGYCYINNAAVAAQYLSQYGKVATIDVDFHHGNGTQHIFYERNDVFTVSIHADPVWKFPHYSGFSNETGQDTGEGFNRNFPLQKDTTDGEYDAVLQQALAQILKFKPDFLVVPYGADTHISDPIGGFRLSTEYFTQMGKRIKLMSIPTMIVQEGGYNNEHLGKNVTAFLKGFV
jgi:acetoin utilization deacetylase AcuC-like enzyme